MSLSGASGSAAGYNRVNHLVFLIVSFMTLLVSVNRMITMFCLNNIMRNTLLVNIILICMMFYLNKHIYDIMIILVKLFLWIKLNMNLPQFITIQKHEYRQFSSVGFAGLLKPTPFEDTHYKRWRQKTILWLTSMHCFYVVFE
jgi:hypothetical protein